MTRKVVGPVAEAIGLAGFGLLLMLALQDDRPYIIAVIDRATGFAFCLTALAIGTILISGPHVRRPAPFIISVILTTVVVDAVLLSFDLGVAAFWNVPAAVVGALLAGTAGLLVGKTRRLRVAMGVLVGVGVTAVLILAVVVLVTVHNVPFF